MEEYSMFDTLLSSVLSLGALLGFVVIVVYAVEGWHNGEHSKGNRGAPFDHNDARGLSILMIPVSLMIICGCMAVVYHSAVWLLGYL